MPILKRASAKLNLNVALRTFFSSALSSCARRPSCLPCFARYSELLLSTAWARVSRSRFPKSWVSQPRRSSSPLTHSVNPPHAQFRFYFASQASTFSHFAVFCLFNFAAPLSLPPSAACLLGTERRQSDDWRSGSATRFIVQHPRALSEI